MRWFARLVVAFSVTALIGLGASAAASADDWQWDSPVPGSSAHLG